MALDRPDLTKHSKLDPSLFVENLFIAPALTKSEHLHRITEWAKKSTDHGPHPEDQEMTANSLLVDEGVRKLRNWDKEIQAFGADPAGKLGGRISAATRLNLIADLNKIKQTVDPEDTITPRIIVKEFQKFIDGRNSTEPKSKKKPKESIVDRRVKFEPDEEQEVRDWRQKALNVGFSVTYPGRKSADVSINSKVIAKQTERSLKKDPDWWRRKIRQGFIQTEEMMTKLVNQRQKEEKIIHGADEIERSGNEDSGGAFNYHPKTYAFLAARATRVERQRLDTSMERLKKRHEECFGGCPVTDGDATNEVGTNNKKRRAPESKKPIDQKTTQELRAALHTVTTRFQQRPTASGPPKAETKDQDYTNKMNKLMSFGIETNHGDKIVKNPNTGSKVPTTAKKPLAAKKEVQVIFERHSDGQNLTNYDKPSDRQMGSKRWPQEYLKTQRVESVPPTTKKIAQSSIIHNAKNANSEWVKRFVEAHKKKIQKDEEEHKEIMEKRKAETNALYKELLFNRNQLEHEVGIERRKMEMSWKFSSPGQTKENPKEPLPNRFRPYEELEESKGPKEPLKYTWNERPKGLNMWLEGVMAKAKEDKETREKRKPKETLLSLSSYQF